MSIPSILVVEDDYEMQEMIGSMFTPDGADWGEANLKEMQELIEEINELS